MKNIKALIDTLFKYCLTILRITCHSCWHLAVTHAVKEFLLRHNVICSVVDTLAASMGEGLIVYKAVEMKKSGKSMDEIIDFVNNHKLNVVHNFTVDDLNHLYRGGRVSKTTAIIGTLANIKPILHVDNEGR